MKDISLPMRRLVVGALVLGVVAAVAFELPRLLGGAAVSLDTSSDTNEVATAEGMQWPVVLRFTERVEPKEGQEWQEDKYFLVARSWDQFGLILLDSQNVRGTANQAQIGQITKVQDGRVQTGYLPEGPLKMRLPEMTDLELEALLGAFPTGAEGVSSATLSSEGAMNITGTLNQRYLDAAFAPPNRASRSRAADREEMAAKARAAGFRPDALADVAWEVCCEGSENWIAVDGLRDIETGLPAALTVSYAAQTEYITVQAVRDEAEDSAERAGLE